MNLKRIFAISQKEIYHLVRDIRTLLLAFLFPVMILGIFGFGVSFDYDFIPLGVLESSFRGENQILLQKLESSQDISISYFNSLDEAQESMKRGEISGFLFSEDQKQWNLWADGTDGTLASALIPAVQGHLQPSSPPLFKTLYLYNSNLKSSWFFVPGLIAYVMSITCVLLTALTMAREWERGNFEWLFCTPVKKIEIIIGKLLPYLVLGMMQILLVLWVGLWVFEVPLHGSFWLIMMAGFIFLMAMLGQGLFISIITKSQQLATMAGALTTLLPVLILSGFLFPISSMPSILQGLSYIFPARYFMNILRGVMLKSASLESLLTDFAGLTLFSVIMIFLCAKNFKENLE